MPLTELHALVPTDLSDGGERVSGPLERLASVCELRVTVAHVVPPGGDEARAGDALDRFLPGVPAARLLLRGRDPVSEIAARCAARHVDLVMTSSGPRSWRRWLAPSRRARLMAACGAPVWTVGEDRADRPLATIAVLVDFAAPSPAPLRLASRLARATGARLRLLSVVRPLDEGSMHEASPDGAPLTEDEARRRLLRVAETIDADVDVDAAVGSVASTLRPLVVRSGADALFLQRHTLPAWSPWAARTLDALPCAVVGFGDAAPATEWRALGDAAVQALSRFPSGGRPVSRPASGAAGP